MAIKTIEEWYTDMQSDLKWHGTKNYAGTEAKYNLKRAKKTYEQDLAYHNLNPSNKSSALAVKRAKENMDYWQKKFDFGKSTALLDTIKETSAMSKTRGGILPKGMVWNIWQGCTCLKDLIEFIKASDLEIISYQSDCGDDEYIRDKEKRIAIIRIIDGNDIYEVTWAGHCRKLSDEEMKSFREEKRNRERLASEAAVARAREQAKKDAKDNSWINQNGHHLGWIVMIGFAVWFIGLVISHMP